MEFTTTIYINKLPTDGAWSCVLKNGTTVIEGNPHWWDDINKSEIKNVSIMGLNVPGGDGYEFYREGVAVPGQQPSVGAVVLKVFVENVVLIYEFKEHPQDA